MEDVHASGLRTANNGEAPEIVKQAACLNCRRIKIRCLREVGDVACRRCARTGAECIIPEYRVGRKKGVKNKRDGLDKAVHRIERAIRNQRTQSNQPEVDYNALHLQNLLSEAQELLPTDTAIRSVKSSGPSSHPQQDPRGQAQRQLTAVESNIPGDNYPVDDAENPLQLLARASDLSIPTQEPHPKRPLFTASQAPRQDTGGDHDLQIFFGPFRPSLDIGDDIDPITMGLLTIEEADVLFSYFYQNLSHSRWGLDPLLHTPEFVRRQSSFLFTSVLSASALFLPTTAALSKRLSVHCNYLARTIVARRNRSPEIVLAFMVNIPWMAPGKHWSDDDTPAYMATALTIAMDISLNKIIIPSPTNGHGMSPGTAQSDCITARKALDMDGFQNVDPATPLGRRLLRRRERIWLALFVLDRGVCLARGRSFTVPLTPLIQSSDGWHNSDMSDIWDGSLISSTVLRRDLADLISNVKKNCDLNHEVTSSGLQVMIEGFFNVWYSTWVSTVGGRSSIPPYVEILGIHGRLSIYSSVINHPTAPSEVKTFFRAASLSSALNVMRAAIQGESRLKSMPNNTVIMISFAAMIALRLSTIDAASGRNLTPSIRVLIEETAEMLERIGSSPPHRNGTSALYGRHLRKVLNSVNQNQRNIPLETSHSVSLTQDEVQNQSRQDPSSPTSPMQMSELIQFSAMSDDQIAQAINDAGDELGNNIPDFQMDDRTGLDWLDWFEMEVNE